MKKFISLVLSLLLISSLVFTVSCGAQEEEVFDVDYSGDYEVDLTGQTYRWGSSWHEQLLLPVDFSFAGDMTHKRINDLKEKYGCTFEVVSWEDGGGRILQEVAAGYNTIDFLDSHASAGGIQLYRADLLYSLDEIPISICQIINSVLRDSFNTVFSTVKITDFISTHGNFRQNIKA